MFAMSISIRSVKALIAYSSERDIRDLSIRQLGILKLLEASEKPVLTRDLASGLGVFKPSISRGLDDLEENGLTSRSRDWNNNDDRRKVYVSLTEAGRALLEVMR